MPTSAARSQTGSLSSSVSPVLSAQRQTHSSCCTEHTWLGSLGKNSYHYLYRLLKVVPVFTSPLSCFDIQELAAVSGHHIPFHQGSDGADVPQSLVKRKQLRGEVERGKATARTTQPPLLFVGQRRNRAAQQCIRLHGGAEEGVGILQKTRRAANECNSH